MPATIDIFRALSDTVRLRIIRAVSTAELSVAELVGVLGLPQSTVSRHLKPLRDANLVTARRDGTSVYYRLGAVFSDPVLANFISSQLNNVESAAEDRASVRRIMEYRKRRSREFFDRIAGSYGSFTEPGGGWPALAAGMAAGFTGREVADLGAGEGALTLLLARYASMVTAVDLSSEMLRLVEQQAMEAGLGDRVRVAEGDIESLPLPDLSTDAAFLSQALHHAASPEKAVREAGRILKPGGLLVILDLVSHEQEWVREQWADQWLGFDEEEIRSWMESGALAPLRIERLPGSTPELSVLVAVAGKQNNRTEEKE